MAWLRYMLAAEIEAARGRPVTFTVIRDGVPVQRSGHLGKVTSSTVWVGAFCYSRREVEDSLQIGEAVDG